MCFKYLSALFFKKQINSFCLFSEVTKVLSVNLLLGRKAAIWARDPEKTFRKPPDSEFVDVIGTKVLDIQSPLLTLCTETWSLWALKIMFTAQKPQRNCTSMCMNSASVFMCQIIPESWEGDSERKVLRGEFSSKNLKCKFYDNKPFQKSENYRSHRRH